MGRAGDTFGGAAAGAGTGALVGSVVPGIGTAAGAVGGALIGGITGYLSSSKGGGVGGKYAVNAGSGYHQYGGQDIGPDGVAGAERRADYYNKLGSHYAQRDGIQADYSQANADYANQMALGQQYRDVIEGKAPSLAQMQLQRGQEDTNQAAMNMAASARGGGGLLAQQQAMQGAALGNQRVNMDAGMLRAQETAQARDAYGNLLSGMRGQSAEQAQAQAGFGLQSRAQNDALAMGYRSEADARLEGQRDANISIEQGNQSAATARATGAAQAAAAQRAAYAGAAAGIVGAGLGAGASAYGGGEKLCLSIADCRIPTARTPSRAHAARASRRPRLPRRRTSSRPSRVVRRRARRWRWAHPPPT